MPLRPAYKKCLKIISLILGILCCVLVLAFACVPVVLSRSTLTRLVNDYGNRYLDARVHIDTVQLSVLSGFPYAEIKLSNGLILSNAFDGEPDSLKALLPGRADSLLQFKELAVSISIPDLLRSRVNIKGIRLVRPRAFAYVAPWGKANWEIYNASDTAATDSGSDMDLKVNIRRLGISGTADFAYESRPDDLQARLSLERMRLQGNLSTEIERFELNKGHIAALTAGIRQGADAGELILDSLRIDSRKKRFLHLSTAARISARTDTLRLCDNLPVAIDGAVRPDTVSRGGLYFDRLRIFAAGLPLLLDGHLQLYPDSLRTDLSAGIESCKIADLMRYLPRQLYPAADSVATDAEFSLEARLHGTYVPATFALPAFDIRLTVPDSYVEFSGRQSRINRLALEMKLYNGRSGNDSLGFDIRKFVIDSRAIDITADGSVHNLLGDPYISGSLCTLIDLDTLSRLFPARKTGTYAKGKIDIDLSAKSRLSNLNAYKIGNADIQGQIQADSLLIDIPPQETALHLRKALIRFGAAANTTDTTIEQGMKMLGLDARIDSAFFRHQDLLVKGSGFRLAGHNAADILAGDTTRIHPFNGQMDIGRMDMVSGDSTRILLRQAQGNFSILPYRNDYKIPVLKLTTRAGHLSMRDKESRYSLSGGQFSIEAVMNRLNRDSLRRQILRDTEDTLRTAVPDSRYDTLQPRLAHRSASTPPGDTLQGLRRIRNLRNRRNNDFADRDIRIPVDTILSAILDKWDISGTVAAASGRITTPYFPLRNQLRNLNLSFTPDGLNLGRTEIRSGESRLSLSGQISGLRRAAAGRGDIRIRLDVHSDTLNFNELTRAANSGMAYLEASETFKDSLRTEDDEEKLNAMIALEGTDTLEKLDLIIIPDNIDADINLHVHYGKYAHLTLDEVAGRLIAKDRCLQIRDFKAFTDAGEIFLDAFYSTRSKRNISTGFDLDLKNIEAEKLITLMPGTDSLLPMLRSLEGTLNCQLAATARIDTLMNIQWPTLRGVARIRGDSLVLLDGETFTEIAKRMHFKNKNRNLIDKMSVEIMIKDNTLEVFPFLIEMDRYRAAVSGTQDLDMNFNYHISVLHSPIPIRLGVDVYGNLDDDFHFRIGKARYKNTNLPVYSEVIDSTRLNLRNYITNVFQRGVDAALRNGGSLEALEQYKRRHQQQEQAMESLSEEELRQLSRLDETGNGGTAGGNSATSAGPANSEKTSTRTEDRPDERIP